MVNTILSLNVGISSEKDVIMNARKSAKSKVPDKLRQGDIMTISWHIIGRTVAETAMTVSGSTEMVVGVSHEVSTWQP
ncbi:MAG: hypothetical protein R2568_02245 [Candidatus Scalindua sp.]|nr:hypothetical protein [Candidatus Scalindua sp.]MDV5165551.1 hypothetical protein [Candidatus Scalindua sp.]